MSSDLRNRLQAAATIPPRPVNGTAIQAEVSRRRRINRRVGAIGILVVAAVFGTALPLVLSHSPQETARLTTSPPPPSAPTDQPRPPTSQPTIQVSSSRPPRDGSEVTVTGAGFSPGVSVQLVPCIPNSDCGAYKPIGTVGTDNDGRFTAHVTLPIVIDDLYGGQEMCVQSCSLIASTRSGTAGAKSTLFNLASLPPVSAQCQPSMRTLQLSYDGTDPSQPERQSAIITVRNTGTSPCWLYGAPGVTATKGNGSEAAVDHVVIDQSAPSWPPKVITLQAGAAAQFTVSKPRCPGASAGLGTLNFGLFGGNYSSSVSLPSTGAELDVSLCTTGSQAHGNQPAPDNVMTVTAFTTG
jgi:hypothetical protein